VQKEITEEERETLDVAVIQFVIDILLQGSNNVVSNYVETDIGVEPLHSHLVTTDDEVVVNVLLAQPMSKVDISRLEIINTILLHFMYQLMF